ncbi:MFS transporter [Paracoccus sp. pheM1]|uniref:MFS transporter n=1 Tax=Paracoccus sp. pheM1 TaxID=2831675 RepID=UPI001BDB89DA|nr:MFS transporter [Paracoccus sp. pheM1]MBT0779054.1 MFS transporter [Paracoccus sp. pheM1]
MTGDLRRRRLALFAFFFIPGVALASWVTRTPAIRDGIDASLAEMGLVLLGLSTGSMCGILLAGMLVGRRGTRQVAISGTWLLLFGVAVMAAGTGLGLAPVVALGLCFFGLGMGAGEIAINVEGAEVERLSGRPLMHALHGCFSLGTVFGALAGTALARIDLPVAWHLGLVAAAAAPPVLWFGRWIPEGTGLAAGRTKAGTAPALRHDAYWRDPRLYLIGLVVLAVALAEGAANDWLPILMVDEHGFSPAIGSLVYLGFSAAMTLGRFAGGIFLRRHGPAAVMRVTAALCATGLALVILAPVPALAAASVVLWGLGASLGFPIAISAAAASGPNATGRVRTVTICGYIAFLVGPPLLGLIGETYGLRMAMLLVLALILAAAAVAGAVRPRAT